MHLEAQQQARVEWLSLACLNGIGMPSAKARATFPFNGGLFNLLFIKTVNSMAMQCHYNVFTAFEKFCQGVK
jgi:hypothetical protein